MPEWQIKEVNGEKRLERVLKSENFAEALEFTNKVGAIAEEQDHHSMIIAEHGQATVAWWTHTIEGLQKIDFIMAPTTDRLLYTCFLLICAFCQRHSTDK